MLIFRYEGRDFVQSRLLYYINVRKGSVESGVANTCHTPMHFFPLNMYINLFGKFEINNMQLKSHVFTSSKKKTNPSKDKSVYQNLQGFNSSGTV